jgi:hypothetical protein
MTGSGLEYALTELAALSERVSDIEALLADDPAAFGYSPAPAPKWWRLTGEDRAEAVARLAAWVDQVYRPSYGHLAATLGACWAEHPLCLYTLDWLSELHSVLYLPAKRTARQLSGQAEYQLRLLPAAADQMAAETRGCKVHAPPLHLAGTR